MKTAHYIYIYIYAIIPLLTDSETEAHEPEDDRGLANAHQNFIDFAAASLGRFNSELSVLMETLQQYEEEDRRRRLSMQVANIGTVTIIYTFA